MTPIAKPLAILALISASTLFASNHVAARYAFDDGAGLVLALVARATVAFLLMFAVALVTRQSFRVEKHVRGWLMAIGVLIAAQSWLLYSSVAIIPIAVSLLLVNSWPMMYIAVSWVTGDSRPSLPLAIAMLVILFGLSLVLNIAGIIQGVTLGFEWWLGVGYGFASGVFLGMAMWITNKKMPNFSGSVRSTYTMLMVTLLLGSLGGFGLLPSGFALPVSTVGLICVGLLALFYGVASTVLFVLAPRLDMAKNSPVLNFEPVASLLLAFVFLGQTLSILQLAGGVLVVGGIVTVSLMR